MKIALSFLVLAAAYMPPYASQRQSQFRQIKTDALAYRVNENQKPQRVELEWKKVPEAYSFRDFDPREIYDFSYLRAECRVSRSGKLRDCELSDLSTRSKTMMRVFHRALASFRVPVTSGRPAADLIDMRLAVYFTNVGKSGVDICAPPYCTPTPPPPKPPTAGPQNRSSH